MRGKGKGCISRHSPRNLGSPTWARTRDRRNNRIHKRIYRLYSAADLAVRKRKKAKRPSTERVPLQLASTVNEVWSVDFVSDSLANGFSHECVDIAVDYGISGQYVTRVLDPAAIFRGYPSVVRTDNGPEFTSRAFPRLGAKPRHPAHPDRARPMQNGYVEELQSQVQGRMPERAMVRDAASARTAIGIWRTDYNEVRPHSSIGRILPALFAEGHRQRAGDAAQQSSTTTEIN